jgi:hypothetical protein
VNPDFIFPYGDVQAVTELLRRALSDPSKLDRRGQDSLRRMQSWSARENISGVLDVEERALELFREQANRGIPLNSGQPCSFHGRHIVVECYDKSSMAKTASAEITKVYPLKRVRYLPRGRT